MSSISEAVKVGAEGVGRVARAVGVGNEDVAAVCARSELGPEAGNNGCEAAPWGRSADGPVVAARAEADAAASARNAVLDDAEVELSAEVEVAAELDAVLRRCGLRCLGLRRPALMPGPK